MAVIVGPRKDSREAACVRRGRRSAARRLKVCSAGAEERVCPGRPASKPRNSPYSAPEQHLRGPQEAGRRAMGDPAAVPL